MAKRQMIPQTGPSFSDVVESTLPSPPTLDNVFGSSSAAQIPGIETVPVESPKNPYAVPYQAMDYTYHHEVFLIHKPWNQCNQCKDDLNSGILKLPETGTPKCPHTDKDAYIKQVNSFLSKGHIKQTLKEDLLIDGSVVVSLSWLVPHVDPKKLEAMRKNAEDHGSNSSEGRN
jgi:hypothetical protein